MAYQRKWLTPRQAVDHISWYVSYPSDPRYQLFMGVYEGTVRVRYHGRELTGEERWRLLKVRHGDPEDPYALPYDIELSIEDLNRYWNEETHPQLPQRKRRGPKPGTVGFAAPDEALRPEILKLMKGGMEDKEAVEWLYDKGRVAERGGTRGNVVRRVLDRFHAGAPSPAENSNIVNFASKSEKA